MPQTKLVEEIKTQIFFFSIRYSRKSCHLWDNVEKCGRAGHATDDNMRFLCWITKATHTHIRNCNTYCFSTETVVSRTRHSVIYTYIASVVTFILVHITKRESLISTNLISNGGDPPTHAFVTTSLVVQPAVVSQYCVYIYIYENFEENLRLS